MVVLKREEMLSLAENAVSSTLQKGADEVEAFVYQGFTTNVAVERGQIARSSRIIDRGLGIRAIINKAVAFSYTNVLEDKKAIDQTILRTLSSAKASKPDKDWHGLPARKTPASVKNTYDERIVALGSEELVEIASMMLDAAEETDSRVFPVEGEASASYLSKAIANSNGISVSDHGTIIECSLATICREGDEVTPECFEFNIERNFNIYPEWVGKEASRLVISALKAKTVKTKNTNVVLTQFALQQLLHYTLINAVKADYVQRNQSPLKNKIGERVASETVTIYDDGLIDGGLRTWRFDGEGFPQQRTRIIEKGILNNFICDSYTAGKEGRESTGNASRAGYLSTPKVEATNFHLLPGKKSPEELLSEVDEGLLVYFLQGAHSSNPASGEFSVVATPAWKIKNGNITHATKGAMLAGNIFQLLMNVSGMANNERKIGELIAPWVLAEDVRVIGK